MLNNDELWLTGNVQNQFVLFFGGFLAITFFSALLLAYTNRRTGPCVIPLSTPRESNKIQEYIVVVYTSAWPGSRCPPSTSVYVNLNGEFHESGSALLKKQKSDRQIFTRGSVDIFVLHTNKEILGNLKDLELELKNAHDEASNWKPKKFEIYKFDSRERWIADIIPSLKCQKHVTEKLKLSKTPIQIPRWKRFFKNFLGHHYWFFHLSDPQSFGIFSTTMRTLLTFFAETSFLFSNIMCYVVYHEPDGVMNLTGSTYVGSLLALFSSTLVILGIEYALCNIRPAFVRRYNGLPTAFSSKDTADRLKDLETHWGGSEASSSTDDDSDIKIAGPIAEVRRKKAAIKKQKALEEKEKQKNMPKKGKGASNRRNRRQSSEKINTDAGTNSNNYKQTTKYAVYKASDQPRRQTNSFEQSRVRFAPNVNKSNPRLDKSPVQKVDHFMKAADTVSVDLTPFEVKHLWLEGRQSSKRLPGEHMNIYTDACDVWETGSSRTSLLSNDSVQNSSYALHDVPLSLCEQGQVTQNEINLNFSSSTDNGSKFPLLDTTRKFATRTWNMISSADIKKWWFEGRKSDKPAEGEHMNIYKTYSEDWDTRSSRSSLSEISDIPHHIIESLRPEIDNFDLTPSDSVMFKSESDTSVNLTKNIEMQSIASDDQLLYNKGSNKTKKSYRSTRAADFHPRRPNRRATKEKQNNAKQSFTSNDDSQIGGSLSDLAQNYLRQAVPILYASPTEDDDDDGPVRFIHNTKKKSFFDVLSPLKPQADPKKIERSSIENMEIPTAEITSLIRNKSKRASDSTQSGKATPSLVTKGLTKQTPRPNTFFPTIYEFDPYCKPKVISLNVKPRNQGSSPNVPISQEKFGLSASSEIPSSRTISSKGNASVTASNVASVASQESEAVIPPTCTSSTGFTTASSLDFDSVTASETKSSPVASSVDIFQASSATPPVAASVSESLDAQVIESEVQWGNMSKASSVIVPFTSSVNASKDAAVIASSVNASKDATDIASQISSVIVPVTSFVSASKYAPGIASPRILASATSTNVPVASPINVMPTIPELETPASPEIDYEPHTTLNIYDEDSMLEMELENQFKEFLTVLNDPYSDDAMDLYFKTKKQLPDILESISYCSLFKSETGCSVEPSLESVFTPSTFSSATTVRENYRREDPGISLSIETEFSVEPSLESVLTPPSFSSATTVRENYRREDPGISSSIETEFSVEPALESFLTPSTSSSATTVRENYRREPGISSSIEMLEMIAEAMAKNMPASSRSASTVTGSLSLQDNTSELQKLASENSSHTTFSDPYLYRPLYPSEYRLTDAYFPKCQFSWLTSVPDIDNNFVPNLLQTILLDIDSLMTNDRAWAYLGKKTHTWFAMVCRHLWNQIYPYLLDRDFVIKQDIRLKRIQNREMEEHITQVVDGSFSSEIDLHTLVSATAESEESERSEIRCVLLNQTVESCCNCGRTECYQLQNIYSDLLTIASSILSKTVSNLYRLISQSERISQESLLDLCNYINTSLKTTAYDLAAVAVEPDLITCYDDLWSFPEDPGHEVFASIIVHKSLRQGAAKYDYEWHLHKRAYFLTTKVIESAIKDVKWEVYEDSVIAKLCQDAISEATKEVLQDFGDPIYIFSQHAIKHKLIHITKDIVRSKHPLSFIVNAVKKLAAVWRLEGLDLSVNITSELVQALIIRIFKEQLKDTRIFSNLVQLKEVEQRINRFVRTAILCATNNLLVCVKTGEPLSQTNLRGVIERCADDSNSKMKSKEAKNVPETAVKTPRQRNKSHNAVEKNRASSFLRKIPQVLAEDINFNIDVASAAVYYYLIDQSSVVFEEYTFDLEISAMVDDIILKARNSLIADQLKKIAKTEKTEKVNLYPNNEFEPSEMYLKMKSYLISCDVLMDAQMSLIEDSIGDPFTLDSREIYELRKDFAPLKMYSKFLVHDTQNKNRKEMVKELKRYNKRHRDYVTINLQNVADSHCITNTTLNFEDRDLYLLEWYLTGQLQKRLSPVFKIPLLLLMFLFTLFSLIFISLKGAELTIIQCQEWINLYILTSLFFAFVITPVKAWCITRFQQETEPFL